jgi:trimethylamine corrinoid protein
MSGRQRTPVQDQLSRSFLAAVTDTNRLQALELVKSAVAAGLPAEEVLFEVVLPAIDRMIFSVSEGCDASLAQHFMTSQIASEVADWLLPRFASKIGPAGCIVIGTAVGDFHGLGKRIVTGCLRAHNFQVRDLGLSVTPEIFVTKALEEKAQIIGVSSMMVHTALSPKGCRGVRQLLKERGLENAIKIIVGGSPYRHNANLCQAVGADAWAKDGLSAVGVVQDLLKELKP